MRVPYADLTHARWRKSTRSGGAQQCVELARFVNGFAIRDSKHAERPLVFTADVFEAFLTAATQTRLGVR